MVISFGIWQEEDSGKLHRVIKGQVLARIVKMNDTYSFVEHLGAAVRDIIPGYHSKTVQKTNKGAHRDSDQAQGQPTMLIAERRRSCTPQERIREINDRYLQIRQLEIESQ